jgi:ankyrin repeat protein
MPVLAGKSRHQARRPTVYRNADDLGSPYFVRIPNELKLILADNLEICDINTLVRTSRALNRLLNLYMYHRAKLLNSRFGRPYFLRAVDSGDITAVRHFIEVGTSVNMCDPVHSLRPTPLISCVEGGNIEIARLLIENGVNPSAANESELSPLHYAVCHSPPNEEMVALLLDAGADISTTDTSFATILYTATMHAPTSILELLLNRGADPNICEDIGATLLHFAATYGTKAKVRLILEAGVNIEATNDLGETALHIAAHSNLKDHVEALLEFGANVDAIDNEGLTPLQAYLKWNCPPDRVEPFRFCGNWRSRKVTKTPSSESLFCEFNDPIIDLLLSARTNIRRSSNNSRGAYDWTIYGKAEP